MSRLNLSEALDDYRRRRVRRAHALGEVRYFLSRARGRIKGAWQHLRHGICFDYEDWVD